MALRLGQWLIHDAVRWRHYVPHSLVQAVAHEVVQRLAQELQQRGLPLKPSLNLSSLDLSQVARKTDLAVAHEWVA